MSGQAKHTPHTPGPWFWNFEGVWILKRETFDDDGNHSGYELLDGDYDTVAHEHATKTAAPELLAACRLTLGAINDLLAAQLEYPDPSPSLVQLAAIRSIEPARAAIAAADGTDGRGRS